MKISKTLHVASVVAGFAGIVSAIVGGVMSESAIVWGITRDHWLFCSGLLMLIAIWFTVSTIHHMMLEKKGEIV
jgi:uncharacterized membrane protein